MAAPVPDHVIRQGLRAATLQGQVGRGGAPTGHSSPLNGPSPESLSPSPPPVRTHELVALPPPRNRAMGGEELGQRHRNGAPADTPPQQQNERLCIVLWVVGASIAFPLVFSAWLVIVPFVVHATWTTPLPFFLPPQSSMSTVPSTLSTTTAVPPTSANPWQNVSSTCIVPVTLSTLPPRLNVSAPFSFGPSNESSRPLFCLFNNTRVNAWRNITKSSWNYVFATLPFALCPYVVYWSVGIEDGNLTSRLPSFDVEHGLYRLRAIADSLNFRTVKILLALGGYPEDAPHFSRLGWDQDTLNHLLDNVVRSLNKFVLNGVTVHWVEARAGCEGPDDATVLKTLLRNLRTRFNSRMLLDAMVTVMLQLNKASQLVAQEAADVVDYIFLATQNEHGTPWTSLVHFCRTRTDSLQASYRWFANGVAALKLRRSQLCLTDSLMPFALRGSFRAGGTFSYAGKPERAPIHLECSWPSICTFQNAGSCAMHVGRQVSTGSSPDQMFLIDSSSALANRLDFRAFNTTQWVPEHSNFTENCVLLLDLDADNYVDQCGAIYARYVLMRNFYYGTLGRALAGDGEVNGTFPQCQ
ncbi:hypothetical protein MTO96_026188 [Rhipicephalus appendiculatus]